MVQDPGAPRVAGRHDRPPGLTPYGPAPKRHNSFPLDLAVTRPPKHFFGRLRNPLCDIRYYVFFYITLDVIKTDI